VGGKLTLRVSLEEVSASPLRCLPPRWLEVWGLNDCHDKEATSSDTSEGRPRPVVVNRHREARKQAQ
jgi:hypothetical protein